MSAKIMGQVWDLELPQNEQSVLLALADHADHDGQKVFPSNPLIAWKLGCSEDTVRRCKVSLEKRGILVKVKSSPGRVNEYRIDLSKGVRKEPFKSSRNQSPSGDEPNPPQIATPSVDDVLKLAEPLANPPQTATTTPSKPLAQLCDPNLEPSKEPKKEPPPPSVRLLEGWKKQFREIKGFDYFEEGRDKQAIADLLNRGTPEELLDIARKAWARSKSWNCVNKSATLYEFKAYFTQIRNELRTDENASRSPAKSVSRNEGTANASVASEYGITKS